MKKLIIITLSLISSLSASELMKAGMTSYTSPNGKVTRQVTTDEKNALEALKKINPQKVNELMCLLQAAPSCSFEETIMHSRKFKYINDTIIFTGIGAKIKYENGKFVNAKVFNKQGSTESLTPLALGGTVEVPRYSLFSTKNLLIGLGVIGASYGAYKMYKNSYFTGLFQNKLF